MIDLRMPAALFALPFVFATVLRGQDAPEVKLPAKESFHLFLLVGQSNMAGRGKVEDQDRQPHPRVLMLTKENRWAPAVAPLHFDKKSAGVGIGRAFGSEIANSNDEVTIGLIPCAHGGSPISTWEPGAYYKPTKGYPYDDALKRTREALKVGVLKGILWHQGESDSKPELCEAYEANLHLLISRFRKEFDAPNVPFIAGQMGQFKERPWSPAKKMVDAAQQDLPKHIHHTAFVNSNGLSHNGDEVHFDSASYRELGRRYAKAFHELTR